MQEGEKPCQIISPQLSVGSQISQNASNGDTGVRINGREITTEELFLLLVCNVSGFFVGCSQFSSMKCYQLVKCV